MDLIFGRVLLLCRGWFSREYSLLDYFLDFSYAILPINLFDLFFQTFLRKVPPTPRPLLMILVLSFPLAILSMYLGAGCGLTSLVLSLCGYSVIATDKTEILPLLQRNTATSSRNITLKSFDWKDSNSIEIVANVFDRSPDLILLSDCFYQSDSVAQLCQLIAKA